MLSDVIRNPTFAPEEVARTKAQISQGIAAGAQDPQKRAAYDQFGHAASNMGGGHGGFSHAGGNMNMDDIFENFGDVFGEGFFGGQRGGGRSRGGGNRGSNLRVKVKLNFEDSHLD